ncbi:MAG: purine-nucleoside phosphorylase [Coriobacteriales bacterium]|nr:purine-nucleoside phosphorylase [Coriobacteriales bacterium]
MKQINKKEIFEASKYITKKMGLKKPKIAIQTGAYFDDFIKSLDIIECVGYKKIPHWPYNEQAKEKLYYAKLNGVEILVANGRCHMYDGFTPQDVAFPIFVLKKLGIETLSLVNISGAINSNYKVGDFCFLKDHINFVQSNPLAFKGRNFNHPTFTDMNNPYSKNLIDESLRICNNKNITAHSSVYINSLGPSLETTAEIAAFKHMGADLVGMSTINEAIATRFAEMQLHVLSIVSNMATGVSNKKIEEKEVFQKLQQSMAKMVEVYKELLPKVK